MANSFSPKCPNHHCPLVDTKTVGKGKGIGICPISSARFDFDADFAEKTKKKKIDMMGNVYFEGDWKVSGEEQ